MISHGQMAVLVVMAAVGPWSAGCDQEARSDVPLVVVKKQKFSRIVEASGYLKPESATPLTVPAETEMPLRITWLAPDGAVVKKGQVVARFDDLELRNRLVTAESDRAVAAARRQKEVLLLDAAGRDRARTRVAAGRELEMTHAYHSRDTAIYSRDQILEGDIDEKLQEAKLEHAGKAQQIDRRLGGNKLGLIAVEARRAEQAIRRTRVGLSALEIRTPHDGVLTLRRGWRGQPVRVGDTVWRSQSIAEVSRVEKMEAEVYVLEAEAAGLARERRAEVVIEAQPAEVWQAKVKRVETVAKRRQQESPTQYFGVVLAFEKMDPTRMKAGQTVRARLFLHEEQALVVPRPALHDRDGRWIAYRRDPSGGFSPVTVKIRASSAGLVAIESGLETNDQVALRDPGKGPAELVPRSEPLSRARR
jgi:HlyD family secretion protein